LIFKVQVGDWHNRNSGHFKGNKLHVLVIVASS